MKTVVVANPKSAGGKLGRDWPKIERSLRQRLGSVDVHLTKAPRHATELVRAALRQGADLIVAVGGDGTFTEVTDGFFEGEEALCSSAALGILPFGTGGDFRKTAGVPNVVEAALTKLVEGSPRPIDVGRLAYRDLQGTQKMRHFLNVASFGLGGLVDQIVARSTKVFGGRAAFYAATIRALLSYRPQQVRMKLDDANERFVRIVSVAIANGRFFGGGMKIAPRALLDDGWFDIVEIGDIGLWDFVRSSGRVRRGDHLQMPEVSAVRAKVIRAEPIDPKEVVLLDVDGEQLGMLPATFEIVPRALLLRC